MAHSRATKDPAPPRSKRSPDVGNDLNRASWMNLDYFFPAALAEVRAEQALLGMPPKRGELRAFTFAGDKARIIEPCAVGPHPMPVVL